MSMYKCYGKYYYLIGGSVKRPIRTAERLELPF